MGGNIVSTDDNQNVLVRYEYDVFGAIRNETGTSDNTRKFTGKEFDADSNLYYYGARYYDPYIGRFTQRDPIGDGVNWYAYVANNPLAFVDPTGLEKNYVIETRAASSLEAAAINSMFQGSINPDNLTIQIVEDLHVGDLKANGSYGQNVIKIDSRWYVAAGLAAKPTASTDAALSHYVITYLSILIHEATHHWQSENKLNRNGDPGYGFNFDQLSSLNLGKEQFASAVSSAFILKWQLDRGAEMVNLRFLNFGRWMFNDNPNTEGRPSVSAARASGGWGTIVNRTLAGSLLWFFNPLMAHIRN